MYEVLIVVVDDDDIRWGFFVEIFNVKLFGVYFVLFIVYLFCFFFIVIINDDCVFMIEFYFLFGGDIDMIDK